MAPSNRLTALACAALVFINTISASPTHPPTVHSKDTKIACAQVKLPITVTANNTVYDAGRVDNNIDAVDWNIQLDTWTAPNTSTRAKSVFKVDDTFNIHAQLCIPVGSSSKSEFLQIATHGIGFDKRYWDSELESEKYSYVYAAVAAGYSILTYDRLGTGSSDKPDPYNVVQAKLQLEVLKEITLLARSGGLAKAFAPAFAAQYPKTPIPTFTQYIHVGHSFGSIVTDGFIAKYGDLSSAAISTGFVISEIGIKRQSQLARDRRYAQSVDPIGFADRGSGWMASPDKWAIQSGFFHKGTFDEKALDYSFEIQQPMSTGEILSTSALVGIPANFKGPILFFLAEYDFHVCAGDCKGSYNLTELKEVVYPHTSALDAYIQPNTGHALPFHANATAGFDVMFGWLGEQRL